MAKKSALTPQSDDFPRWDQDVVAEAEIDGRINACGVQNAYFPQFIPELIVFA